jgi:hypothetical protein
VHPGDDEESCALPAITMGIDILQLDGKLQMADCIILTFGHSAIPNASRINCRLANSKN